MALRRNTCAAIRGHENAVIGEMRTQEERVGCHAYIRAKAENQKLRIRPNMRAQKGGQSDAAERGLVNEDRILCKRRDFARKLPAFGSLFAMRRG